MKSYRTLKEGIDAVSSLEENFQLWLPSDSFKSNYNIIAFQEAMTGFQTLSILHRVGEAAIYCSSDDHIIYHTVTDRAVKQRHTELQQQSSEVTSCLQPDQPLQSEELAEEARVRELHLGLGKTCLLMAVGAEEGAKFTAAAHDLQQVFSMLTQPIHSIEAISKTAMRKEGLIYMFVQAARRHRALTPKAAGELADGLNQGILPLKNGDSWIKDRGKGFVERAGFATITPHYPKQSRKNRARTITYADRISALKLTPAPEKKSPRIRTDAEIFINLLLPTRRRTSYQEKLTAAHATFVGKEAQPFNVSPDRKLELGKLGVEAYLEAMSKHEGDEAGQILKYITRRRSSYKFGLLPLIVAGNLLTARVNANGGFKGKRRKLPGLQMEGLAAGFGAIRHTFESEPRPKAKAAAQAYRNNKKLGDIVEAYLRTVSSEYNEQSYEITEAPEGVMSGQDFARKHRISKGKLDTVIGEHGIDAKNYMFGRVITRGLNLEEQEQVLSMLDEIRVEPAPPGYRSVSGVSIITGIEKSRLDRLIRQHGIEVGRHRFRSTPGASLSPEAQHQLEDILNSKRAPSRATTPSPEPKKPEPKQ